MTTYSLTVTNDACETIDRDYVLFGEPLYKHISELINCALGGGCGELTLVDKSGYSFEKTELADADICIFTSPMAFTLPENLLFDSAASVAAPSGPVVVHGATTVYAADVIVVGTYKEPVAVFFKGEIYRSLIEGVPGELSQLTERIRLQQSTPQKGTQKKVLGVRNIFCGEPINTRNAFFDATDAYRRERLQAVIAHGADIPCTDGVVIAPGAHIGTGTLIEANVTLGGEVNIGSGCVITSGSSLKNCTVGDGVKIFCSYIDGADVPSNTSVKPFSVLSAINKSISEL